jgi:selenoprotein W-related protein
VPFGTRELRLTIRYCDECGYAQRAAWTASELLTRHGDHIQALELQPGSGGEYEVWVNGGLVHSKTESGAFPEIDQLSQAVARAVDVGPAH